MRQRAVDAGSGQARVFVDTQPRPVQPGEVWWRKPASGPSTPDDAWSEKRAWLVLAGGTAMLLLGVFFVTGNHYAHLHRHVSNKYADFLAEWDAEHRAPFAASAWVLNVDGLGRPLPLLPVARPSRTVTPRPAPPHHEATQQAVTLGAEGAAASSPSSSSQHWAPVAQSEVTHFQALKLIDTVYPFTVPAADRQRVLHGKLWRPVSNELHAARTLLLHVHDGLTGAVTDIPLGAVQFTRERVVRAGGEARCMMEEHGSWQADNTCLVQEFLYGLCVKVLRNPATGAFRVDNSTGGPGCWSAGGWELGTWRRIQHRQHRVGNRVYLPASARNATIVSVRHARDPNVLEAAVVEHVTPHLDHQILFHVVGLALCFLAAILLISVAISAAPILGRRLRTIVGAVLGRRPKVAHE